MKRNRNKGSWIVAGTCVLMIAAGGAALANASKLSNIFEPVSFDIFNNQLKSEEKYYSVTGDGEKSDLADEDEDGENRSDEDTQKAEQAETMRRLDSQGDDKIDMNTTGQAEKTSGVNGEEGGNSFEIVDNEDGDADGIILVAGDGTDSEGIDLSTGGSEEEREQNRTDNGTDNDTDNDTEETDVPENQNKDPDLNTDWAITQLTVKEPVITSDGELISLKVETPDNWQFCIGDAFSNEGVRVTATFSKDGQYYTKEISYGGSDGYTVSFSTDSADEQQYIAIFSYESLTARAAYTILDSPVKAGFGAYMEGNGYYRVAYPSASLNQKLGITSSTEGSIYASSGALADLTDAHSKMIAYLGDSELMDYLVQTEANGHAIVRLEEENGLLTKMMTGFRYMNGGELRDDVSYVYYPVEDWGRNINRALVSYVAPVPEGYQIKRETKNEGTADYSGEQVLIGYTGSDSTMTVPMGTTVIRMEEVNPAVQTIVIPESVQSIDFEALSQALPNLTAYEVSGSSQYQVVDGALYSKDGTTLLSVPSGMQTMSGWSDKVTTIGENAFVGSKIKTLTIPATVTTLATNCMKDSAIEKLIFTGTEVPDHITDSGYSNLILVPDSEWDTVCKEWVIALADSGATVGVADAQGNEITSKTGIYTYMDDQLAAFADEPTVLAGISSAVSGRYLLSDKVTAIGSAAFAAADELYEVEVPATVTAFRENSLVETGEMKSLTLRGQKVAVSGLLFGDPSSGKSVPDIVIYVPQEAYGWYLTNWSAVLDPVYGTGTAEKLLKSEKTDILYTDNAKYQILEDGSGTESYRLLKVLDHSLYAFEAIDNTTEVAADAFEDCSNLEIIFFPKTLKQIETGTFDSCTSLETVVVDSDEVQGTEASGASVLKTGEEWEAFLYEDGAVYGQAADGSYTLLNVPTVYTGTFILHAGTVHLADAAFRNCQSLTTVVSSDHVLQTIGDSCFENCTSISSIVFSGCESLVSVGDYAFKNCTSMEKAVMSYVQTLGKGAFYNCTNMTAVRVGDITEISDECFYNCQKLLSNATYINASNLETIGERAFAYCLKFAGLSNAKSLKSLGDEAFIGCRSLTKVILPETMESIGEGCFSDCVKLESVEMNGQMMAISRYCFFGCWNLQTVTFSEQQKAALKLIGAQAFAQCYSLEKLDWSDMQILTLMGEGVFDGDQSLTTVKLPESLESLPDQCFADCENLSILSLFSEDVVTLGTSVFGDELPAFLHLWVQEEVLENYRDIYQPVLDAAYEEGTTERILGVINENTEIIRGVLFEKAGEDQWILVEASTELSGDYTVTGSTVKIADEAFKDCKKLTGIEFEKDAEISFGNRCFIGCDNLETVRIYCSVPEWGDEVFMDCQSINKVEIAYNSTNIIPRIGTRAFKNCTGLKGTSAVVIRAAVEVIGEESFAGCTNLVGIPVIQGIYSSLREVEDRAFEGCSSITTAIVNNKYTSLERIGNYAFSECDSLKQPSVAASVTEIGEGCFQGCDSLMYVSFYGSLEEYPKNCFKDCPKLIRTGGTAAAFSGLKRIGESAYEGCTSLVVSTSWYPGRYSNLEEIGDNAFKGCTSLTDITLSETVTKIGTGAFDGCTNITNLQLASKTPPQFGQIQMDTMAESFMLKVPDSEADGDVIYLAYRDVLSKILGQEITYRILDSVTDGAKERHPLSEPSLLDETEVDETEVDETETETVETERVTETETEMTETGSSTETGTKMTETGTEAAETETKTAPETPEKTETEGVSK